MLSNAHVLCVTYCVLNSVYGDSLIVAKNSTSVQAWQALVIIAGVVCRNWSSKCSSSTDFAAQHHQQCKMLCCHQQLPLPSSIQQIRCLLLSKYPCLSVLLHQMCAINILLWHQGVLCYNHILTSVTLYPRR